MAAVIASTSRFRATIPGEPVLTFLSCCLQGLEETRSYNADVAHLTLLALVLAAVGTVASGAVAAWLHVR
jgi:hypothetical protein